jgi:hypothetical protein
VVVIRRASTTLLFLAAVLTTAHARAERASPCALEWNAASVPEEWLAPLHDVRSFVAQLTADTTDCRTIAVSPDDDGATVVFTTADGRSATRRVGHPRELRGLVEALLVNGRDPAPMPPPPPPPSLPASTAASAPATSPDPTSLVAFEAGDTRPPSPRAGDAPGLLLGAGAGVKGSFPRDALAGVGQLFAGATLARWELAAFGRWELEHDGAADASARRLRYSAVGGGAMFGRREVLGPVVVIAGVRAAVLAAEEERVGHKDVPREPKVADSFVDPRLGLYAGCIFAELSRVRFRVQVDADAGVAQHRAELAELPAFPRWNLGISLGAETGLFR